ncbi:thermonuclease family protein [Rubritalea sp.]|uniref:thermonuclease family protein n=1 Tax=Rubritalea sp. TaxID=2109375 RepID=UPI003EF2E4A1
MAKKKSIKNTLVLLVILGVYFIFKYDDSESSLSQSELTTPEIVDDRYSVLEGCTLISNRRNDGDSFFVKHPKGETEFRLYFVDTPESAYKEYWNGENNGKRLDDQAEYFGIDRESAITAGVEAKDLMHHLLENETFTVVTKWENVYSPERKYAFVITELTGKKAYFHEVLVQHGLARIHTKPADLPSGVSSHTQLKKLRSMESQAKELRLGAWSQ